VLVYRGHNHAASVAKFSPSGNWVASGDASGRVRIWAWDNPEHVLKLEVGRCGLAVVWMGRGCIASHCIALRRFGRRACY
jgi:WD40 repeat protein